MTYRIRALASYRAWTRESLLQRTKEELEQMPNIADEGRLTGKAQILRRIGKVLHRYKPGKSFH